MYPLTPTALAAKRIRDLAAELDTAIARAEAAEAEAEILREALKDTTAHLVAAASLLSRSPKNAASSDKMFDQMLADYAASIDRARAALNGDAP